MARVIVMPMLGKVKHNRVESLQGCHALYESAAARNFDHGHMAAAVDAAIKEVLLSDYCREQLKRFGDEGVCLIVKFQPEGGDYA